MPTLTWHFAIQRQSSWIQPFTFREIPLVSPTGSVHIPFPTTFKIILLPPKYPNLDHTLASEPLLAPDIQQGGIARGKVIAQATIMAFKPSDDDICPTRETREAMNRLIRAAFGHCQGRIVPGFIVVEQNSIANTQDQVQRREFIAFIEHEDAESKEWLGKLDLWAELHVGDLIKASVAEKKGISVPALDYAVAAFGLETVLDDD